MKRILVAVVLMAAACAPSKKDAVNTAAAAGLVDVAPGGRAFFGCGADDQFFGREFMAKNARGGQVSGYVCCGSIPPWSWSFKGCTVRF